jgi:D-3-phosphoglycerate dehydrogenase
MKFYIQNEDVPGVIGVVGTLVGEADVNVATMHVGRKVKGDKAIMLLNIDNILTDDALAKFQDNKHIICAKVISL